MSHTLSQQLILSSVPASGTIPFGEVVYVDDGSTPGYLEKIIGGNNALDIPRITVEIPDFRINPPITDTNVPVYIAPSGGEVSSYVSEGDGTHLSDILSNGASLASALQVGFENLSLIDGYLGNANTSRFVDSIAHAIGAYDSLSSDASAYELASASNKAFSESASNFAAGAAVLGAAGNVFEIYEGVSYLATHPIDSTDSALIEAQQKLVDGSTALYGFVNNTPGFGAAGALLSNALAASEYANQGDYATAAQTVAKGITIFGFAGIGQILNPENGADAGAQIGGAAADLAKQLGDYTAGHVTGPLLDTPFGEKTTSFFYDTFLKHH